MKSKAFQAALEAVASGNSQKENDSEEKRGSSHLKESCAPQAGNISEKKWMNYIYSNEPSVSDSELISLKALIAYVAYITGRDEFRVERQFADRFNIPNVKCLPESRYDDAVRYLVDQVPTATTAE